MSFSKIFICFCLALSLTGCATFFSRVSNSASGYSPDGRFGEPYKSTKALNRTLTANRFMLALVIPGVNLIVGPILIVGFSIDFIVAATTDTVLLPVDLVVGAVDPKGVAKPEQTTTTEVQSATSQSESQP